MTAALVMNALFYLSLAGALLASWRLTRPMPGPMEWAIAAILFALAFGQMSAGMPITDPLERLVNTMAWLAGGMLLINGLRRFFGFRPMWRTSLAFLAALAAVLGWVILTQEGLAPRIITATVGGLLISGAILFTLVSNRGGRGFGLGFAVLGFGILFAVLLVRLHFHVFEGPPDLDDLGYLTAFAAMPTALAIGLLGLLLMTIERLVNELRDAKARVEEASRAKTDFLLGMGHELRTPLNAILGFNQLLATDPTAPLTATQAAYVHEIEQGGRSLLRLIDDAHDVERIELGGVALAPEALDVARVLRDAVAVATPASRLAGVALILGATQGRVLADRGRLQQVLGNLLSNAVKYNRPGGEARLRAWTPEPGWVRIEVADNGPGIPHGRQGEVFQRFNRLGAEHGPIDGTGIGLAIARDLTQAMGGRMGFESVEGQGARFWLDLPAA